MTGSPAVLGKKAGIAIRVNPDVDPRLTLISTGMKKQDSASTSPRPWRTTASAAALPGLEVIGVVDCHRQPVDQTVALR
ncbi:MAG: hypothetical protein R2864_08310 [Syntrophotaleaceae bacterium]